jgi:hypothetical protein
MEVDMCGDRMAGPEGGRKHKAEFVLPDDIAHRIAVTGFRPAVGDRLETKSRFVKMGGLFGIAHIEFDIVGALQGQEVGIGGLLLTGISSSCNRHMFSNFIFNNRWPDPDCLIGAINGLPVFRLAEEGQTDESRARASRKKKGCNRLSSKILCE